MPEYSIQANLGTVEADDRLAAVNLVLRKLMAGELPRRFEVSAIDPCDPVTFCIVDLDNPDVCPECLEKLTREERVSGQVVCDECRAYFQQQWDEEDEAYRHGYDGYGEPDLEDYID